jgi:hypothetical protein
MPYGPQQVQRPQPKYQPLFKKVFQQENPVQHKLTPNQRHTFNNSPFLSSDRLSIIILMRRLVKKIDAATASALSIFLYPSYF